jgi:hypothetical protein
LSVDALKQVLRTDLCNSDAEGAPVAVEAAAKAPRLDPAELVWKVSISSGTIAEWVSSICESLLLSMLEVRISRDVDTYSCNRCAKGNHRAHCPKPYRREGFEQGKSQMVDIY